MCKYGINTEKKKLSDFELISLVFILVDMELIICLAILWIIQLNTQVAISL